MDCDFSGSQIYMAVITIGFEDGLICFILYSCHRVASFPNARELMFAVARMLQLDCFRMLKGYSCSGSSKMNLWKHAKGQTTSAVAYLQAIQNCSHVFSADEIFDLSQVGTDLADLLLRQSSGNL